MRYIKDHSSQGRRHSEESKLKISKSKKGDKNYNYGKHLSDEHRKNISEGNRDRIFSEIHKHNLLKSVKKNQEHPRWKGDDVGYGSLHDWVKRHFPKPNICHLCLSVPPRDLANITGIYNRELRNWAWFCKKCHNYYDNLLVRNLKQYQMK